MSDRPARASAIDLGRLQPVELVQLAAALLVGVSLYLPWYTTASSSPTANVRGHHGDVTAWAAHPLLRWFLLAAVAAALLSSWQTIAAQAPTQGFHRGETSVVVAVIVAGLVVFQGLIDRPGTPSAEIDLGYGWFLAIAASLLALAAAINRLPATRRKPPGV
jgi:hypothetical protein